MFEKAAAGVTMRDGRVGVCGLSKTPSPSTRTVTGSFRGVQGALFKGQPWRGLSADNGQRPSPSESAKHLLTAAGCQKCLCVTFAKVTKADYFASPAHPHRRKENYNYG